MIFTENKIDDFRKNNFDLVRLFAAFQVVIFHSSAYLNVYSNLKQNHAVLFPIIDFFKLFPGVPIFFFTSGFLISRSFENNSRLREYALNRILRIYPALIVCVFVSILSVIFTGYLNEAKVGISDLLIWFLAKSSFVQFYNPEFMRGYGVGVVNGALWTICVELQFYILVPLVYSLLKIKKNINNANIKLLFLIVFFLVSNRIFVYFARDYQNYNLYKLAGVSFLPWFYMFLTGMFFQRNFDRFYKLAAGNFVWILFFYCFIAIFLHKKFGFVFFNEISPLLFFMLVVLMFSLAFTWRNLSSLILKHNDVSYGVYLYHMPIVNLFIYFGFVASLKYNILAIILIFCIAVVSWKVVEKPALSLKKHPLNPLNRSTK